MTAKNITPSRFKKVKNSQAQMKVTCYYKKVKKPKQSADRASPSINNIKATKPVTVLLVTNQNQMWCDARSESYSLLQLI